MLNLTKIFNKEERENVNTQDGMRNLYFDRNRKHFIKFFLDVTTTCQIIYNTKKKEITSKIKELHGGKANENDFCFCIVELKNKTEDKPTLIEVKIEMDFELFKTLQNSQLILCYLLKKKPNNDIRKLARNKVILNYDIYEGVELHEFDPNKKLEIFYPKSSIYLYDKFKKSFVKDSIIINEKNISFYDKQKTTIIVSDIKRDIYFTNDKSKNFLNDFKITGNIPNFCIKILTSTDKFLFGKKNYNDFIPLQIALNRALVNARNISTNTKLDGDILAQNCGIFATCHLIVDNCFIISEIICNKEKRKIFFKIYPNKKIANLIDNIILYKTNSKKLIYSKTVENIQNIIDIYDTFTIDEKKNYEKFFKNLEDYKKYLKKINELKCEDDKIKEKINNELFDNLLLGVYLEYIVPFFGELKSSIEKECSHFRIPEIKQNFQMLLAYYLTYYYEMNKFENFYCFNKNEIYDIMKDFNESLYEEYNQKYKAI